jgi:pilus assembly protein CpaC
LTVAKSSTTASKPAAKAAPKAPAPKQQVAQATTKTGGTGDFEKSGEKVQAIAENPDAKPRTVSNRHNIMRVLTGKSLMIDLKSDAKRVSVANPGVAEVMIISPRQVMINGLADGETTVIIWDNKGNYTMYSLVVGEALAEQVMLEVTVAEINRTAMEKHGVDFRDFGGQFNVITQYGNVAGTSGQYPPGQDDPPFPVSLDGGISWAIVDTKNDIAAIFNQIQDENLGRILAEPKLLARSGKKANFLSGGEIPIVVTTNDDTSIEFKEFGTKIDFIPVVREDGTIDLTLQSEVSEPDFSAGVELFGFNVPAFVTRRTQTDVTLRNKESLIVAGLIKETKQEIESKMPFMGDIPFLGYFFRSTEYQNDVLELVMVVKPKLVKPIEAGERVALPTDRGPLTRSEVRTAPVEEKVTRPRPY